MKSAPKRDIYNIKEESDSIFIKMIQNINEIDLNSEIKKKKRSFSCLNFLMKNKDLKNDKLSYFIVSKNVSFDKDNKIKNQSEEIFENNNNILNIKNEEKQIQNNKKKNFISKKELLELNKKGENVQFNNLINDNNNNNNIYNNNTMNINNSNINYNRYNININLFPENNMTIFPYYNNNISNFNNNRYLLNEYGKYCYNEDILNDNRYGNLTKTQFGSQLLKNKIITDNKYANEILFPSIKNNIKELCSDIYGNLVIQTLLQVLTQENIDIFLYNIKDQIKDICETESGSRIMQIMIDKIKDNNLLLNKLIYYLNNNNLDIICKSKYGNYFIKYYLDKIKNKQLTDFIYNYIYNNFINITNDKFGVLVIQKAFYESDEESFNKLLILTEQNFNILIKNNFGNYLIKYIFLQMKNKIQFNKIFPLIKKIEENILEYCKNKNSSGVLEKLFEKGAENINEHIINYLLDFHSNEIINLLIHPNGYYVIKKIMNIKNKNIKKKIIKAVVDNKSKLESDSKNKTIVNTFCEEFSEFLF
jgi:hypothetical protein